TFRLFGAEHAKAWTPNALASRLMVPMRFKKRWRLPMSLPAVVLQAVLLLVLAPLVSGIIRNWKAKFQNRRGPRVWQPYFDMVKFLRKDMVISEHASSVFTVAPYVVFLASLLAGLMVPLVTMQAPLSLFGGALAVIGLLALGRFFLAL